MKTTNSCAFWCVIAILACAEDHGQNTRIIKDEIDNYIRQVRPDFYHERQKLGPKLVYEYTIQDWTRLSDLVVMGRVKNIEGHPESPYRTWITIQIDTVLKGQTNSDTALVKIISGPLDHKGGFGKLVHEPSFVEKENVIVFLSSIPLSLYSFGVPPGRTRKDFHSSQFFETQKLAHGYYEIWLGDTKWNVDGERCYRRGRESEAIKVQDMFRMIHEAVRSSPVE